MPRTSAAPKKTAKPATKPQPKKTSTKPVTKPTKKKAIKKAKASAMGVAVLSAHGSYTDAPTKRVFLRGVPCTLPLADIDVLARVPSHEGDVHLFGAEHFRPAFLTWKSVEAYNTAVRAQRNHLDQERLRAAERRAAEIVAEAVAPRTQTAPGELLPLRSAS